MFFHLQYIHLFRPFLKYAPSASPLPPHVSPRRICSANAGAISKLLRLYKKLWNLRQICNIAVYMVHSACTIHLLNLPEKTARRDIIHGVKHLEEIAEDWLCARRTLSILSVLARKWNCELPEDAAFVLQRADEKYGTYSMSDVPSPQSNTDSSPISDGGLGLQAGGDYSPLTQYTQTQLARPMQLPAVSGPLTTSAQTSNIPIAQQQGMAVDRSRMPFGSDTMSGWSSTPSPAPMPGYQNSFAPINQANMPPGSGILPTNRRRTSSRAARMDGQEWFLNDSARWHQSFETWQMTNGGQDASVFMFGEGGNNGTPNTNNSDGNVSMQAEANDPLAAFDGLGASLSGDGWLPGLD